MKKSVFITALTIAIFALSSCQKETPATVLAPQHENIEIGKAEDENCTPTEVALIAGQTINSGTVSVTNDANFIYVTYATTGDWLLVQTHLYVGDCAQIPVNNAGNPIPGQFPYSSTHNYATSHTYQIPASTIGLGSCGCIAAHAVVVKVNTSGQVIEQQTGWGNGVRINANGGNWGMKFDYCTCTYTP